MKESTTVVLFGATGDLAQQKLLPALLRLAADEAATFPQIIAIGRRPYDTSQFLEQLHTSLGAKMADYRSGWELLASNLRYCQMDFLQAAEYGALADALADVEVESAGTSNRLFYLSVPPDGYTALLAHIAESGLAREDGSGWRQVVIEKPFGRDAATATELDRQISQAFTENQVYRVDHYLAKETVQNLLAFRFANGMFEPLWKAEHVDHIQITVAEEEGIKTRAAYYDTAGAFRDVLQNHILQLVALLLMEAPSAFDFNSLSDAKAAALASLEIDPSGAVFGQYQGYLQEPGVAKDSATETYAMATFLANGERWKGTPVYVRTGKKLAKRVSEISVQFKEGACQLFANPDPDKRANVLTFRIQPDEGISLLLGVKAPRHSSEVRSVSMEFCYGQTFRQMLPDAYERLFHDLLLHDRTLALRHDSILSSWKLVDRLLAGHAGTRPLPYAAGSWGPAEADAIIESAGRRWLAHESTVCNGIVLDSQESVPGTP